jgi:topoisomerase-4 subunit B
VVTKPSNSWENWENTTHDWAATVDTDHLAQVRDEPDVFAAGGTTHLILEVLAYAADEAESTGTTGRCVVTLHANGSVSVADNGRGTDTRHDAEGQPIKKPIMATKDLRFFDHPGAQQLPDGHPRRGMSAVAALSQWLVHTNRRHNGAWTQWYEHGIPVTALDSIPDQDTTGTTGITTGTTVHFLPAASVHSLPGISPSTLRSLTAAWPPLIVEVIDERTS